MDNEKVQDVSLMELDQNTLNDSEDDLDVVNLYKSGY